MRICEGIPEDFLEIFIEKKTHGRISIGISEENLGGIFQETPKEISKESLTGSFEATYKRFSKAITREVSEEILK